QSPVQRKASRPGHGATYGISVIALTEDIARQLGVKSTSGGVVVSGIREGSPSDDAGLKRGDIIMSIEHNRVLNTDSFKQLVTEPVSAEIMLMHINRGGRKFYITMDISS
ncbi:MAG: PDZ domain-containing protein, partial [Aliifodinibius sp.]|nr:PDZ domain-containing protein [Phycisphaerae bacterium]NIT59434.1 PDZ domain-containing protein [Fodinibius sp.]NIV14193.1 PDZ domain-containing protein [Fodinibius sp.]NIY28017.1 PDZ domain-containing protein [Fodinibius sp.]